MGGEICIGHLPTGPALQLAIFGSNVIELQELAEQPGATLEQLLACITDQTIASIAFADVIISSTADARLLDVTDRVRAVVAAALIDGQRAADCAPRCAPTTS
jgi:hypothetical protein